MWSQIQRHFTFSDKEKRDLGLVTLVSSLIIFLFIWRTTSFTLTTGIVEYTIIALGTGFAFALFVSTEKILAIVYNYTAHYSKYSIGLLVGFIITFLSYGLLPILLPGHIELKRIRRLSHGERFILENKKDIFLILTGGLWFTMVAGIFFQVLYRITSISVFHYIMIAIAGIVAFGVLPLPHTIGLHLFYVARKKYYYILIMGFVFGILLIFNSLYALILAALLAAILTPIVMKNPIER